MPAVTRHGSAARPPHPTVCTSEAWCPVSGASGVSWVKADPRVSNNQKSGFDCPVQPAAAEGCSLPFQYCQPVSAFLGLAPHLCVEEPQVPAGHRYARAGHPGPCWVLPLLLLLPEKEIFLLVQWLRATQPSSPPPPPTPHMTNAQNNPCEILLSCQVLDNIGMVC